MNWLVENDRLDGKLGIRDNVKPTTKRIIRRQRKALARLCLPPHGMSRRGDEIAECAMLGDQVLAQLSTSMEQATKEARYMPYDNATKSFQFTVRQNKVDCLEVESVAAALSGVEKDRYVLAGFL